MLRNCDSAHCSGADAEINAICTELGWPVNHPVLTRDATGPCICSCSCLAFGTPVQTGANEFKAIEAFEVGDTVLAASTSLEWTERTVVFSQGTTGVSRQKFTVLIVYEGGAKFLAVTSDHLFLLADRTLKAADKLTTDDQLVDPEGNPVAISSVHIGDYTAGFHHIATAKERPAPNLEGHLLNTGGVVSADYTVQLFYRTGELASMLPSDHEELPVIGSPEYIALHGEEALDLPAAFSAPDAGPGFIAATNIVQPGTRAFIPANATRLRIPAGAHSFISDAEAAARAAAPKRRFNDPLAREWTESLMAYHRFFYPEVQYSLDWASNEVNAYAWVDNGVRHVGLMGGLVRDMALLLEGIALVLAHELGHHYGGPPTSADGASCEGQSDYAGVARIMRRVWFGEDYIRKTDLAIAQMAAFFNVPNDPNAPGGSAGCNHPAGACRVATYHRAVSLQGKPGCAA